MAWHRGGPPPEPRSAGRRGGGWPRALLALLFGGVLIWLAAPRLLAAFALLPGDPLLEAVQGNEDIDAGQVATLLSSREQARRFLASPEIEIEIGIAELLSAEKAAPGSAERRARLDRAIESLRRGLALAPRATFAWAKLAYALFLQDGLGAAAVDAWRMSILTAPAESRLVLWRAEFGALALQKLDTEDQRRLADQIRYAWRFDRESLARMGRERGLQLVLRRVLSGEPDVAELNRLFTAP
jgi:tetratricopeptide (TPR) repeat protein